MKLQRMKDERSSQSPEATDNNHKADGRTPPETDDTLKQLRNVQSKKRKADESGEEGGNARKRNKGGVLPEGFFDEGVQHEIAPIPSNGVANGNEIKLPSRPATPAKTPEIGSGPVPPKVPTIDEDEWAAFEADIAATEVPVAEAVISAPAISAAELAAKSREEESAQRKERQAAEMEGDKEDAARKLEEEFEEMGELEERVRKLKEKREALRTKEAAILQSAPQPTEVRPLAKTAVDEEDEDDEEDDEDDWAGFRFKS
jgi:zinc finger protein 830